MSQFKKKKLIKLNNYEKKKKKLESKKLKMKFSPWNEINERINKLNK